MTYIAIHLPTSIELIEIAWNAPRARWKREWRRQRLTRRGVVEQPPAVEIGVIEGVRFY